MTTSPTQASEHDEAITVTAIGWTNKFYENPKLLSELRLSRFEGLGLMAVLNTHFTPSTPIVADDNRRHVLVNLLKDVFTNINLTDEVRKLNAAQDNKEDLCEFLNQLSKCVSFFSNFSTKSKAVLQFSPSDVVKHINDMALTGAISVLSIGGLAALANSAVRAKVGGVGVIGGITYLAIDRLLGDSKTKDKLMAFSEEIINFYDIPSQTPAVILNACFLPFFTEPALSQITVHQMREFVSSKGKKNYNQIVNRSLILKSVFATLPNDSRDIYFNTLSKIFTTTCGKNPRRGVDEKTSFFSAKLFAFVKRHILPTVQPETQTAGVFSYNVTHDRNDINPLAPLDTLSDNDFISSFRLMDEHTQKLTLTPSRVNHDLNNLMIFPGTTSIGSEGIKSFTLSDELEFFYHDFLGNAIIPVSIPTPLTNPIDFSVYRTNLIEIFQNKGMDVTNNLKILGVNNSQNGPAIIFRLEGLLQSPNIYNLNSLISVNAIKNHDSIDTVELGTFENFAKNPTERILLKLAGVNSLSPTALSSNGNKPTTQWPANLSAAPNSLQRIYNALRNTVVDFLEDEPSFANSPKMFQLLSLLLRSTINRTSNQPTKLGNILKVIFNSNSLMHMVQQTIKSNLALYNDEFKQTHRVENGPVELYLALKDQDGHLAALLAHAYAYPEDRNRIAPSVPNTYEGYIEYFNKIKNGVDSYINLSFFDAHLDVIDRIKLRNVISTLQLQPQTQDTVSSNQYLLCKTQTVPFALAVISPPSNLDLPEGYTLYRNETATSFNIPSTVTPYTVLAKI